MSRTIKFRLMVEERPGLNLEDYLTLMGATEPAKRNSLRTQLRRSLIQGGANRDLVESGKVKPSKRTGPGAPGDHWANGSEAVESTVPAVIQTSASSTLKQIADELGPGISPETRKALEIIAETIKLGASERKLDRVVEQVETIARRELVSTLEAKHYKELADAKQQHIDSVLESQRVLYDLIKSLVKEDSGNIHSMYPVHNASEKQ